MTKFAVFDGSGFPTAFYSVEINGEAIPPSTVEISDDQWLEFISNSGLRRWLNGQISIYTPPSPEPMPYAIAKTTPWLRMTDDEAELITGAMQQANARQKAIYDAAQYLSSGDPLWSTLHDMIASTLGSSSRADELLAPET